MRVSPLILVAAAVLLTGCSATVNMEPAESASDPGCADVSVALPEALAADSQAKPLAERTTDAQATAAWGDPTGVLLRCGVPEPAPSTDMCVTVSDVDWLSTSDDGTTAVFVTYGRSPAVEVVVDTTQISGLSALEGVSDAVSRTEQVAQCLAPSDVE